MGDADVKTVIDQLFGNQCGGLTVIFDAQNSRAHVPCDPSPEADASLRNSISHQHEM
jgi:hypothetical protein